MRSGPVRSPVALALLAVGVVTGCGSDTSETIFPRPGGSGDAASPGTGGMGGAAPDARAGNGGSPAGGDAGGVGGSGGLSDAGASGGAAGGGGTGAGGTAGGDAGGDTAGGGGGGTGGAPPTAGCGTGTYAVQVIMEVTWPSTTAAASGSGRVFLWNRTTLEGSGQTLSGMLQGCGTVLPETSLTALGRIAAGGNKILIEVPDAVWDAPAMPRFPITGSQSASGAGATVTVDWVSLVGATLADPRAPWPTSYAELTGADAEGDGKPGYTAAPRGQGGYVLPPTAVGLGGSAPAAERLFLVSRNVIALAGTRASCEEMSGTANVGAFDSHVLGCQVRGGGECNKTQTDFLDGNRMRYQVRSATFRARRVPEGAGCNQVRAALPPM